MRKVIRIDKVIMWDKDNTREEYLNDINTCLKSCVKVHDVQFCNDGKNEWAYIVLEED